MSLTPLMAAALAGNAALVEELLKRGARADLRDHTGRLALHFAICAAYQNAAFARGDFGAVFDMVASASFEVQVGGRLVQVGREQGEYLIFNVLMAQWSHPYHQWGRGIGFTAADMAGKTFELFPEVVVREARRKRTYPQRRRGAPDSLED